MINFNEGYILAVDKPYGWTSADVVRKIKTLLKRYTGNKSIKVGHAGTLDPLATGLLIICIGKATKQAEALQAQQKEYIAEIYFGATTPSYDLEKEIDAFYPHKHITTELLTNALTKFTGEFYQIPPIFSAKLINGVRAYEYARKGEVIEMRPSLITINEIEILNFTPPKAKIRISCSKGTYIRSLARDLGIELNSGAYLSNLRRTKNGDYIVNDSITVEEFEQLLINNTRQSEL